MNTQIKERPSLAIVKNYNAPPEKVWHAWTDPEILKQWFHPGPDASTPTAEVDLKVGGAWHIQMLTNDCEDHDVSGVYQEIIPNKKLVFTWAWKSTPERESQVTIELQAIEDGTQLTLTHEQFFDKDARDRHNEGWTACLSQLENFINS